MINTVLKIAQLAFPLFLAGNAVAGSLEDHDYDEYNGDEINQVCAGCHEEFGMGGSQGKYPRLAGMPVTYLVKEMIGFRSRTRPNMPMVEHVDDRQMPDEDIYDISIFLSQIKLSNRLSIVDENAPDFDAYARLQEAKSTLQIGRAEGDIDAGKKLYNKECKSCHGRLGEGDVPDSTPMLAGQYTNYLKRQIVLYKQGKRLHDIDDPEEEFLKSFTDEQIRDIFAYVSLLDD